MHQSLFSKITALLAPPGPRLRQASPLIEPPTGKCTWKKGEESSVAMLRADPWTCAGSRRFGKDQDCKGAITVYNFYLGILILWLFLFIFIFISIFNFLLFSSFLFSSFLFFSLLFSSFLFASLLSPRLLSPLRFAYLLFSPLRFPYLILS